MANSVVNILKYQKAEQFKVDSRLAPFFEYYWSVSWEIPEGESFKQKVVREPKADIYFDFGKKKWFISEISKSLFEIDLEGKGRVFGIKLRPGTQWIIRDSYKDFPLIPEKLDRTRELVDKHLLSLELIDNKEISKVNEIIDLISKDYQMFKFDNTSGRKIQRLFKKYIGLSIKWIITRYRVMDAIKLSKEKPCSWSDLAFKLGYSDQSHLSREFKANTGYTLNEYYRIYNSLD